MDTTLLNELETKTYNFAIETVSFVKYLIKMNLQSQAGQQLLIVAGQLGTTYLNAMENTNNKTLFLQKIDTCLKQANQCLDLLKEIDCKEKLANEKAELMIEAAYFARTFYKILSEN